jgi:prepilin-type processing-associated H-X9-DG protein
VLFGDSAQVNTFQAPASPEHPMIEEFYYLSKSEPTTHFRHNARAASVFVDGHVSAEAMEQGTRDERLPRARIGRLNRSYFPD